jgi:hypothetical protein
MDANQQKAEEDKQIRMIKDRMPKVYGAIKAKADVMGNDAYALVRRGLRGEAGCFFASEGDIKVGTYWQTELSTDVAQLIERYGMTFVCMWPVATEGSVDGPH